jgi:HTH-like domain
MYVSQFEAFLEGSIQELLNKNEARIKETILNTSPDNILKADEEKYFCCPVPESEENLLLMRLLDEQHTRTPFYGTRKMTAWLHTQGYPVERKRVRRLLRLMGLEAIYPKPRTSVPGIVEQRYPYLLRGINIEQSRLCYRHYAERSVKYLSTDATQMKHLDRG